MDFTHKYTHVYTHIHAPTHTCAVLITAKPWRKYDRCNHRNQAMNISINKRTYKKSTVLRRGHGDYHHFFTHPAVLSTLQQPYVQFCHLHRHTNTHTQWSTYRGKNDHQSSCSLMPSFGTPQGKNNPPNISCIYIISWQATQKETTEIPLLPWMGLSNTLPIRPVQTVRDPQSRTRSCAPSSEIDTCEHPCE